MSGPNARAQLEDRVLPVVQKALDIMAADPPEDPLRWLGEWLLETAPRRSHRVSVDSYSEPAQSTPPSPVSSPQEPVRRQHARASFSQCSDGREGSRFSVPHSLRVTKPGINEKSEHLKPLHRGGHVAKTSAGYVQFGAPPETLKDSLQMGIGVPTHFVLPPTPFRISEGLNVAEIEFPTYFNFFVKQQRVNIVTTKELEQRLRIVFEETLFGPPKMDARPEFGSTVQGITPDLAKECAGLTRLTQPNLDISVDNMMRFTHFEFDETDELCAQIDENVRIVFDDVNDVPQYIVYDSGEELCRVGAEVSLPPPMKPSPLPVRFEPPLFGVTMLGNSTGFDPAGSTSGIVIWINQRGVMVDPPPYSSRQLEAAGIPAHLIEHVILTHAHADHDAGLFQKIFSEKKVTVLTSQTVMTSFLRKYAAITDLSESYLQTFFNFRPAEMGVSMGLLGGEVLFHYALHTIPCVGFQISFGGKSIVYTADHCNDPEMINLLYEHNFMSAGRRDFLLNFPWHASCILHEAGPPPIHTPISVLQQLSDDVKERLYLYHIGSKDVLKAGLKIAPLGVRNTIVLDALPLEHASALALLDVFSSLEIFTNELRFAKARDVLHMAQTLDIEIDTVVQWVGAPSSCFIVMRGSLTVSNSTRSFTCQPGNFTGWEELLDDGVSTVQVVAHAHSKLIKLDKDTFWYLFRDTTVPNQLQTLKASREAASWKAIEANSVLTESSMRQKMELSAQLALVHVKRGDRLWTMGARVEHATLVNTGSFMLRESRSKSPSSSSYYDRRRQPISKPATDIRVLFRGALLLEGAATHTTTVTAVEDSSVFLLKQDALLAFCSASPGLHLRLFSSARCFVDSIESTESYVAQVLLQIPFLSTIDAARLNLLAHWFYFRNFATNEVIFMQGQPSDCMYILVHGSVEIFFEKDGKAHVLNRLGAGSFMGEIGLLENCNRSASATALEESLMLCLTQEQFLRCLNLCPELIQPFNSMVDERRAKMGTPIIDKASPSPVVAPGSRRSVGPITPLLKFMPKVAQESP